MVLIKKKSQSPSNDPRLIPRDKFSDHLSQSGSILFDITGITLCYPHESVPDIRNIYIFNKVENNH